MTTRHLLALFDSVYLLAMATMVGGLVFQTFVVGPIIFRVMGAEAGGRFVRTIFPRTYLWNSILGAVALPAFVGGPLCFPEYRGLAVGVQSAILLAIILTMLYGGNSLVPEMNRTAELGVGESHGFTRLHRRAALLNVTAMLGGVGLLVAFACRPAPRTQGIIELSPIERARQQAEATRGELGGSPAEATRKADGGSGSMHTGGK